MMTFRETSIKNQTEIFIETSVWIEGFFCDSFAILQELESSMGIRFRYNPRQFHKNPR